MNHCEPQKTVLAEGPFCKIEGCGCGTMHVSIGPITIRLQLAVVESVWQTLGEALARCAHGGARRRSVPREHLS